MIDALQGYTEQSDEVAELLSTNKIQYEFFR
jgi:hypothetical protein